MNYLALYALGILLSSSIFLNGFDGESSGIYQRTPECIGLVANIVDEAKQSAVDILFLEAIKHYDEGDIDQAKSTFEQAATLGSALACHNLGVLSANEGLMDKAEGYYKIAADGDLGVAQANLGGLYYLRGDMEKAELYLKKAIENQIVDKATFYTLGLVYHKKHDEHKHEKCMQRAASLDRLRILQQAAADGKLMANKAKRAQVHRMLLEHKAELEQPFHLER